MNTPDRLDKWLDSLGMEILTAQAGSTEGQFPIVDLLGNIRDATAAKPAWAELHGLCAEAWEQTVRIVESGQPFSQQDVDRLNALLGRLQMVAKGSPLPRSGTRETARPVPPPAATPVSGPETGTIRASCWRIAAPTRLSAG